ncbi:hypothetical protein LJR225_002546 [Phenylobacterium sp. LjRoot225]|uniref:hypothetical protein n=1 Tax=Phenylobacterium sp. LjRoot225 TaxID=3342285 RepID=UPI003ECF1CA9
MIVGLHQAGLLHGGGGRPTTDQAVAEEHASAPVPPATAAKPELAALPASAPGPNLLAVDQGGNLIASPSDGWSVANDGDVTNSNLVLSRMGAVFGFKDDAPATFNRFGYLVLEAGDTPASIEIAAGDTPSGPFRIVGTVKPQDLKIIATGGWQYFELPKTTARHVKITLGDSTRGAQGGFLTELGLYEAS